MDDYKNPVEGKTYVSPRLNDFDDSDQKVRIISKVINSPESYAFAKVKDEVVLRRTWSGIKEIKAKFFEDDREIFGLSIQGYTVATDKPHNASFSFLGDEIYILYDFLENISSMDLSDPNGTVIEDKELNNTTLSDQQAKNLFHENESLFSEVLRSEITTEDIISVGYRKKQLDVFFKLLTDDDYFQSIQNKKSTSNEGLWQKYFEKNQWVFGYGLGYIFLTGLDDKKLEQIVAGHSVSNHGKRVDALMKTKGIISNLCFIEIKTHLTNLLENKPYRSGCWAPSKELAGAIAQVQGTVASAVANLGSKIELEDNLGNPTGEEVFNYQPKSYLVVGSLSEFSDENGVNKDKLRSFELFRKNIKSPEIITFDELYERARFIVNSNAG